MREEDLVLQPFPGRLLPARCLFGMTEERSYANEPQFGRNLRGVEIELPFPYGTKFETRLSNSGERVRLPTQSLVPGLVLDFESTLEEVEIVEPGDPLKVEAVRDIVEGSASARTLNGTRFGGPMGCVVANRTVNAVGSHGGDPVEIKFRLRMRVMVISVSGLRSAWTGSTQGFTVVLREVSAP